MDLEKVINEKLNARDKITLKWDCGGDEAIIYIFVNGNEVDCSDDFAAELEMYILNLLELPDAGEFSMEGKGEIIKEKNKLFLECNSEMEDCDEPYLIGFEEEYSGKFELFEDK